MSPVSPTSFKLPVVAVVACSRSRPLTPPHDRCRQTPIIVGENSYSHMLMPRRSVRCTPRRHSRSITGRAGVCRPPLDFPSRSTCAGRQTCILGILGLNRAGRRGASCHGAAVFAAAVSALPDTVDDVHEEIAQHDEARARKRLGERIRRLPIARNSPSPNCSSPVCLDHKVAPSHDVSRPPDRARVASHCDCTGVVHPQRSRQ